MGGGRGGVEVVKEDMVDGLDSAEITARLSLVLESTSGDISPSFCAC